MRVRLQKNLTDVHIIEASSVIIENNDGTPVAVAIEANDRTVYASTLGQPDFQQLLQMLGVTKAVHIYQPEQVPLSQVHFNNA